MAVVAVNLATLSKREAAIASAIAAAAAASNESGGAIRKLEDSIAQRKSYSSTLLDTLLHFVVLVIGTDQW